MKFIIFLMFVLFAGGIAGCSSTNHHGEGALIGATAGAVVGQQISGRAGAVVGAVVGGVIGAEIGEGMPKKDGQEERKLAIEERVLYNKRMKHDGYAACVNTLGLSEDYCAGAYGLPATEEVRK